MEQEQTLYKIKDVSKLTGELFLKILFYMTETIQDRIQTYQANKTFVGETNWNKFMATDAPKEIKQFRSEEMNLERLKEYLNDYQIGFSVREMPDSTMTLAFETKNKAMVEQAFSDTLEAVVEPDKLAKVSQKLVKTPENMNVKERLAYYQEQSRAAIQAKQATRATKVAKKESIKEEVKA